MIRKRIITETSRKIEGIYKIDGYEGETIENKVKRMTENKEPIKDGAPLVYTEKKDGVLPQYNIRTDKWDLVLSKMEPANKQKMAKAKGYEIPKKEEKKTETPTETKDAPST